MSRKAHIAEQVYIYSFFSFLEKLTMSAPVPGIVVKHGECGNIIGDITRAVTSLTIPVSNCSSPGGAGHATYFYGSPTAETAAIQYVVSHFLEKLLAVPVVPGSPVAEMAMVDELIRYMKTASFAEAEVFTGIPEAPGGWIAGGHFRAPTITAIAAARHSIVNVLLQLKIKIRFP